MSSVPLIPVGKFTVNIFPGTLSSFWQSLSVCWTVKLRCRATCEKSVSTQICKVYKNFSREGERGGEKSETGSRLLLMVHSESAILRIQQRAKLSDSLHGGCIYFNSGQSNSLCQIMWHATNALTVISLFLKTLLPLQITLPCFWCQMFFTECV